MAKKPRRRSRSVRKTGGRRAEEAPGTIQNWLTDPMAGLPPLQTAAPAMPGAVLPTRIIAPATALPPKLYATSSAEFRYWSASEALRRAASFWNAAGARSWHPNVGASVPVRLDDGVDLNAYYARDAFPRRGIKQGLSFFHDVVRSGTTTVTVFTGESPDIVAHELGHAVLDALKPALWGLSVIEAAAFHESFGDMSAILTALEVPEIRQAAIEQTGGRLGQNSLISRVAEQLGWAIRQSDPGAVDSDCLRNAANRFRYADPAALPLNGPASGLTQRPHNFSRVFTGAFLEMLGGMVSVQARTPGEEDVRQAAHDMGALLARAVVDAPVRARFFAAVAEQLVLADSTLFNGKYASVLTAALVGRGLLPARLLATPAAAAAKTVKRAAVAAATAAAVAGGGTDARGTATRAAKQPVKIAIDGSAVGVAGNLYVEAPLMSDDSAPGARMAATPRAFVESDPLSAVHAFVEGLVVSGRLAADRGVPAHAAFATTRVARPPTHHLVKVAGGVELIRLIFECA